jgi:hypothetical protein
MTRELNSVEKQELRNKLRVNKKAALGIIAAFILVRVLFSLDFVEKKYKTWHEAELKGVFNNTQLPAEVPQAAFDILISNNKDQQVYWGKFYINRRSSVDNLLSNYTRVEREEFRAMDFPHPGGYPWSGNYPTLADLESYDGRREKIEYYSGSCANERGAAVIVYDGYEKSIYFGCKK